MKTKMYNTKRRKTLKIRIAILFIALIAGLGTIHNVALLAEKDIIQVILPIEGESATSGLVVAQNEPKLTIEQEVLALIVEAGLNPYKAWSIIDCESSWRADAIGVNTNGTYDRGLWQINSIHKNINNTDAMNYIKATKWAIEKRLHDKNWSAWSCN